MMNYKLILTYDGTRYRGWQKQGNTDNTIQSKIEYILSRIIGENVEVAASGRTDAGVHARRQTCSFKTGEIDTAFVLAKLREYLPEDIGALSLEPAPDRFHARLSCREKTYVYRVRTGDTPEVFERNYVYRYEKPLDTEKMRAAADILEGTHDFSAFTSNKHMKKSAVRTIHSIMIERQGEELRLTFTGDGFLYNMVRILTGTLLEAGNGERDPESIKEALSGGRRELAGYTAPAKGLILWDQKY